jgi:uncharacterized repeat protein (TIGR03803 family)
MLRTTLLAGATILAATLLPAAGAGAKVKETVLYSFCQGGQDAHCPDGSYPEATLTLGRKGALYGVTTRGGVTVHDDFGDSYDEGVVFEISPRGGYTILHAFDRDEHDPYSPEGCHPQNNSVTVDKAGNVYGAASECGYNPDAGSGQGNLFKLTPDGTETYLHQFGEPPTDGADPAGGLFPGKDGTLFGTTTGGITNNASNGGTIFALSPGDAETVLYSFDPNCSVGCRPNQGVVADRKGNLYGTTSSGANGTAGTIFKLSARDRYSVLHTFAGGADGAALSGVTLGPDGNLYGAAAGGANNSGRIYRVTPEGQFATVHDFGPYGSGDGIGPNGVVFDTDGNMYGSTSGGGANECGGGCGAIFKVAPDGTESVIFSFQGGADGLNPHANLNIDNKGHLYGTTFYGGANGAGTVFKIIAR